LCLSVIFVVASIWVFSWNGKFFFVLFSESVPNRKDWWLIQKLGRAVMKHWHWITHRIKIEKIIWTVFWVNNFERLFLERLWNVQRLEIIFAVNNICHFPFSQPSERHTWAEFTPDAISNCYRFIMPTYNSNNYIKVV
jgi:hypothetical protein